jgi:LTXXQ motif family protein
LSSSRPEPVTRHGSGGWQRSSHGRFERQARFERFCANDTARYHPVVRAFVRADLRLSDSQAAEFERLADSVLPSLEEVKREVCNDFVSRRAPAPERLAHLAGILRKAADTAEKAIEPSRAFYASLNEQQKQRVDELTERRGHRPRP